MTKTMATLLAVTLWVATITVVMSQTLLSSHYVEQQLDSAHGYDRLSKALIDEISHSPELAANPEVATKLQSILTADVVKTKLNSALDQAEAYYQGKGPQPTIDLTDLAAQAQAAGIPIGKDSGLTKPVVLGSTKSSDSKQNIGPTLDHARLASVGLSILLAVTLLLLSWRRKRYTTLPTVLIVVGVLISLLALVLNFAPGIADQHIKFNTASNAFIMLGHDLTGSIAHDLAKRFGLIAALYLVVGIGTRILARRLQATPSAMPRSAAAKK